MAGSRQWRSGCEGRRGPGGLGDKWEVKIQIDSSEQASSQLELFFLVVEGEIDVGLKWNQPAMASFLGDHLDKEQKCFSVPIASVALEAERARIYVTGGTWLT